MANRELSDAAEHETFPGPGPLRSDEAKRGIRPVEQMVDAAIDRIAREQEAARDENARKGAVQHALALASTEGASTSLAAAAAAASASTGSARRANARLRWKGLDVSDEFRSYAERVARGEDLPPFKGKILAEPDAEFPWDPKAQRRAEGRALKRQFGLWSGVALFLGLSVWVLWVQVGKQPDPPRATTATVSERAVSTTVLSNQPGVASSGLERKAEAAVAVPQPSALQVQPAALEKSAAEAAPSPTATTALASLQERGKDSAAPAAASSRAAPSSAASPSAASPSAASPSAASLSAAPTKAVPAPAGSSVGVFVATGSPSADAPAQNGSAAAAHTPPGASGAVPGSLGGVAPVTAGSVAPAASAAAPANAGGSEPVAAAPADPKKEPGREASAMGPLLVETPSF